MYNVILYHVTESCKAPIVGFVGLVLVVLIVCSLLVINYSFQKLSHIHAHHNFT